jgi:ankyrin repeat protein
LADQLIFVSSSGDLRASRNSIRDQLDEWLRGHGVDDRMAPYLWEDDVENTAMLTSRVFIQESLPDPAYRSVGLTICLFGERCGLPLPAKLPSNWEERITSWRAGEDGSGLVHPWPIERDEQATILRQGGFPLTGTVFEMISAFSSEDSADDIIIGYVASRPVELETRLTETDFNERRLWERLTKECGSSDARERIREQIYQPQTHGLLNLLKYLSRRFGAQDCFPTAEAMQRSVLDKAKTFLRKRYGFTSLDNPFKGTLEHWTLNDPRELPGRLRHLREIPARITAHPRAFTLLKGRSGCGKSSLLQRGVLARLKDQGCLVLPCRPTEIEPRRENEDHLDVLFDLMAETANCPMTRGDREAIRRTDRPRPFARHLVGMLERRNQRFVLALDQFEEVLDELQQLDTERGRRQGWWLVMRFLSEMARCGQVTLIGTLESSRAGTFEALRIESEIGLQRQVIDVDVNGDDVAEIAETGFTRAGIKLDLRLVEKIKSRWEEFEAGNDARYSASPLPLACLWLAHLFDRFEDKARVRRGAGTGDSALQAFSDDVTLTLEELGGEVSFSETISQLADAAWSAARGTPLFPAALKSDRDLMNTLNNLLAPLVAVDADGHKRLLSVGTIAIDHTTKELRDNFRRSRLLVPASEYGGRRAAQRYRLAHQAIIDHWPPGRIWFEWSQPLKAMTHVFALDAQRWARNPGSKMRKGKRFIQAAAVVLNHRSSEWETGALEDLGPEDEALRRYAIAVFHQSRDPSALIKGNLVRKRHIHLAAQYHFVDLIRQWSGQDKGCLARKTRDGDSVLHFAAWVDGPAVALILEQAGAPELNADKWHPIEASIQMHAMENYRHLVACIPDLETPIGPDGRTMLWSAANYSNHAVLNDLLGKGANPNPTGSMGWTALHMTAFRDDIAGFDAILHHCEIDVRDENGRSPIALAASVGASRVLKRFVDNQDISPETADSVLRGRDREGLTPLMLAAEYAQVECLRLLLSCEQGDIDHRDEKGRTLLHRAVMKPDWHRPSEEEKIRVRRTVETLLEDGRIDPADKDADGKTAFDLAKVYKDARRVIRRHMPEDYARMSAAMRIEDLESRDNAVVLRLVRNAPQVLSDVHDEESVAPSLRPLKKRDPRSGLRILMDAGNVPALATLLDEKLVTDDLLIAAAADMVGLAAGNEATELRKALLDRIAATPGLADVLLGPKLLNLALDNEDDDAFDRLVATGVASVQGSGPLQSTAFHDLAALGDRARFHALARRHRLVLPLDDWGRRPSDLAADRLASQFRELEADLFDPPQPVAAPPPSDTKFHKLARARDLKAFERQARGAAAPLPRDAEGRIPSDVAPEDVREAIAAIEATYFARSN